MEKDLTLEILDKAIVEVESRRSRRPQEIHIHPDTWEAATGVIRGQAHSCGIGKVKKDVCFGIPVFPSSEVARDEILLIYDRGTFVKVVKQG